MDNRDGLIGRDTIDPLTSHFALDRNLLHLVQRDGIAGAIVELGGARALVRRPQLGVLQGAAIV